MLLIGGLALALGQVLPQLLPRTQQLVFDLGTHRPPVTALEFTWTREGQDEPTGGVTLNVVNPEARRLRYALVAPDGDYVLHVTLRAMPGPNPPGPARMTSYVRRVSLQGGETTLQLDAQQGD